MKKNIICIAAFAACLVSCNKEDLSPEAVGDGIYVSIEQPALPSLTKTLNWNNGDNSLAFTWADKENVVVFGDSDAALLRSKTAGETSTKLESKGFDLKDGVTYYAFIPSSTFLIDSEAKKVPVTFLGQRQVSNNSTAHLKDFDYACAEATKADGTNSLSFALKNQVSWLVIEHLFTENTENVTSLKISVPDRVIVTGGKYDVTASKYYTSSKSTELTLALGKEGGDGLSFISGELFRAFLTISPVDLSGKAITVTAYKKDGSTIDLGTYTYPNANFEKNKPMIIQTNGTSAANPVVTVNGRELSSLQDAINETINGETKTSTTITLLDDVNESVEFNDSRDFRGNLITTIIELNGHSIVSDSKDKAAFTLERGEVTFKNGGIKSSLNVAVKFAPTTTKANVYFWNCNVEGREGAVCTSTAVGSRISINGGTFSASDNAVIAGNGTKREGHNTISLNSYNGKAPAINGRIESNGYVACGIYAPWNDVITINAAEFNIENGVGILSRGGQITINDATIVTTGGDNIGMVGDSRVVVPCRTMFIDTECEYPELKNASIIVKGGKYSDDACGKYLLDSTFGLKKDDALYEVANNGDIFSDAVSFAKDGDVISVDYNVSLKSESLLIKKDCEINLAKDVVVTAGFANADNVLNFCKEGGNNVLSGEGTVAAVTAPTRVSNAAVWVNAENQTLTVNDGVNIVGGSAAELAAAIEIYNGKLVINGGHFISGTDSKGNNSPAIYLYPANSNKAVLEISGGVFESVSGNAQFLINCDDDYISNCKITITGGTFVGWNPAESHADMIDGKPANWVSDGYVSKETTYEGKQAWIVSKM